MPVSTASRSHHTAPTSAPVGEQTQLLDWTVPLRPAQFQRVTNPLLLRQNLHLIAHIVSFLDDPADLARVCRTCRVLHYMTIPLLYSHVSLVHHSDVRISPETGRPVGCGGATPFFMGLNALVTNSTSSFVKSLEIRGEWRKKGDAAVQQEEEENARLGLVPDSSMMLSLLVRTAIEKCTNLETFHWEIDTKMLPTVWAGLATKQLLTDLTIRMPSSRAPMPVIDAPAIPNLKKLSVYDIDPLCHADSLSTLLHGSKKLEHLKLHWSPRMRRAREPSTNIQAYFGKCLAAMYAMPLKSFAMQNLYSLGGGDFGGIVDSSTIEAYTLLSSVPGENDTAEMAFVGYNWQWAPPSPLRMPNLKQLRGDRVSRRHVTVLAAFTGLERYYLASGRRLEDRPFDERIPDDMRPDRVNGNGTTGHPGDGSTSPHDSIDDPMSPGSQSSPSDGYSYTPSTSTQKVGQGERAVAALGPAYLEAVVSRHGSTIKELLLMPHWRFTPEELVRFFHAAPHIEHLGIGVDVSAFAALAARQSNGKADFKGNLLGFVLRVIQPHSRKLKTLRLLDSPREYDVTEEIQHAGGDVAMEERIAKQTWGKEFDGLRWVGIGDYVFEIRPQTRRSTNGSSMTNGSNSNVRRVRRRPLKMVTGSGSGLSVYRMDKLTLDV